MIGVVKNLVYFIGYGGEDFVYGYEICFGIYWFGIVVCYWVVL